jgi:DNA replication protein DnaC
MLTHPTWDTLQARRLHGRYTALNEQMQLPDMVTLSCEERLGLLVDREVTARSARQLTTRLRQAKWRQSACLEDVDYQPRRGLDQALLTRLATCQWVREHRNILSTGPTGVGNTWLACALGHQACREGFTTLSLRLPRLLQELSLSKGDGRYPQLMTTLAKTALLLLDDWGLAALSDENRRDLLALLEDRHDRRATLVTSQLPVAHWHEALGDPTLADAILDRLVHKAYKIPLTGASLRKRQAQVSPQVMGSCD